jgi:DNA invertase Pin-like site-specific DNA recombinase
VTKRIAIYARVSTNSQTVENQLRELHQWAERAGHEIVEIYKDEGISGTKGRDHRPAFDRMLKDATRRKFDLIAAWSVDRLGRSLQDLVGFLQEIKDAGVDLFLHQQALDTSTSSGKAMFGMLGVFGDFEAAMIKERVNSGLARARANGTKSGKAIGRPKTANAVEVAIRAALAAGNGIIKTAKLQGVGVGTVQRIKATMPV